MGAPPAGLGAALLVQAGEQGAALLHRVQLQELPIRSPQPGPEVLQSPLDLVDGHAQAQQLLQGTGTRLYSPRGDADAELAAGWSTPVSDWLEANGYPQELGHFLRAFRDGEEPSESGLDGVRVLEILCAAYASARSGRAIEFPYRPRPVERAVDLWLDG